MNKAQFEVLTEGLGPQRKNAADLVLFHGMDHAAAERKAHGGKTNTVGRDVKRLKADFARAVLIVGCDHA
jgi:hypothetical protein